MYIRQSLRRSSVSPKTNPQFGAIAAIVFAVTVVISIALTVPLSIVLSTRVAPVEVIDPNENLTVKTTPWQCPDIELAYQPDTNEYGGICIAWYNATTLYMFKAYSGTPEMRAITYNENRTIIESVSSNLFTAPYVSDSFTDCTFYAKNDTFFLLAGNDRLSAYTPQGDLIYDLTLIRPVGLQSGSTALFFDTLDTFYMDNGGSAAIYRDSYQTVNVVTGVISSERRIMTNELGFKTTRITGADLNPLDGNVYVHMETSSAAYQTPSVVGRLNLETNVIEALCAPPVNAATKFASITFDVDGVAWVATGGQTGGGFLPQSIYRYTGPFVPTANVPTTFTLECSPNLVLGLDQLATYEATFTITGTGCFESQVRVINSTGTSVPIVPVTFPEPRTVSKTQLIVPPKKGFTQRNHPAIIASNHAHYDNVFVNYTAAPEFQAKRQDIEYDQSSIGTFAGFSSGTIGGGLPADDRDPSIGIDSLKLPTELQVRFFRFVSTGSGDQTIAWFDVDEKSQFSLATGSVLLNMIVGDCITYDNQRALRTDHEANQIVFAWTTNVRSKLCVALTTSPDVTAFDLYEFDFPGSSIEKLEMSVWGDHYTFCWNDVNDVNPWSKCHVLERARMLDTGLGLPRLVAIPLPTIVSGVSASSMPLHQEYSIAQIRPPLISAYPCGVFVSMTASLGGILNLKLCQSVNFDLGIVLALDSITTIGSYNDGSNGTCVSQTACIDTGTIVLDPNRYDVMATFRHFPEKGIQRLGIAIVVDADGTSNSKILTGTFLINNNGQLTSEGNLQTFNPTSNDVYTPAIVFTQDGVFWLNYRQITAGQSVAYTSRLFYNMTFFTTPVTFNGWTYTPPVGQNRIHNRYIVASAGYNSTIVDDSTYGTVNAILSHSGRRYWNTQQKLAVKFFASDDCDQYATCLAQIVFQ